MLTLSRDVTVSDESTWYIIIRNRYGEPSDPIPIEPVDSHHVRLLNTLPYIETDSRKEPSHFVIGKGSEYAFPVKITAITPEDVDNVMVAGCIESELVHTADEGEVPPPPPEHHPPLPGLDIEDLISTQGGTVQNPVIYLSWAIAPGADHYQVEYRPSDSDVYQPAGSGFTLINNHEFGCEPGLIVCRVAALAAVRGDWVEVDVNAGGDFDTPGQVTPELAEPFAGEAMRVVWAKEPAAARYLVEVWSHGSFCRSLYLERDVLNYEYHYSDAQKDAADRTITVKVRAQNAEGINGEFGEVTATNPAPDAPTGVIIDPLIDSFIIRADPDTDADIREFRVYGSETRGFVPDIDHLLYANPTPWASLSLKGRWYFRCAWVDQWGATDLNFSSEGSGDSGDVDLGPIEKELEDLDDKINKEIEEINLDLTDTRKSIADLDEETDKNLETVRQELLADIDTSVSVEEQSRISADEALSKRITTVSADLSDEETDRKAAVQSEANARATEDEALGSRIDTVAADLSTETINRTAAVQGEATARATEDETLAQQITTISSELDDEVADRKVAIQTETTARTTADESLATQISQVQSSYQTADGQLDAAIRNETTARTTADEALSSQISAVIADYKEGDTNNSADIQQESTARADADGALGKRIDTVQATANNNTAAIQSESEARADADGSLATRIDTVQAVADDNTASVQQNATAIATVEDGVEKLEASWGVTLDVNGYCSGFVMNNDGDSAEALFRADTFAVGSPGVESLTFVVKDGAVLMPGVSIEDGAIKASHLTANSVTAGKIAADAITGREISSSTTVIAGSGDQTAGMNGYDSGVMENIRFFSGADKSVAHQSPFRVLSDGFLLARNAEISGTVSGTLVSSSDIQSSSLSSSNIYGGEIEGSVITGGMIVGSTIISGEQLYQADPYGNGTPTYYADATDVMVTCKPMLNSHRWSGDVGAGQWRYYHFPFYPASVNRGTKTTNRFRFRDLRSYGSAYMLRTTASVGSRLNPSYFELAYFDPVTQSVTDSDMVNILDYRGKTISLSGFKVAISSGDPVQCRIVGGNYGTSNNNVADRNGILRIGYRRTESFSTSLTVETAQHDNSVRP